MTTPTNHNPGAQGHDRPTSSSTLTSSSSAAVPPAPGRRVKARRSRRPGRARRQGLLRLERCDRGRRHRRLVRAADRRRARVGDGQPGGPRRSPGRPAVDGPGARRDVGAGARARTSRLPVPGRCETGLQVRSGLQGPDYMKRQRQPVARAGVRILDHSPVLELLVDDRRRRRRGPKASAARPAGPMRCAPARPCWRRAAVRSSAAPSAATSTPATATCSPPRPAPSCPGMEFSNSYSLAPAGTSVTKSAFYLFATFYREDGIGARGRRLAAGPLGDRPHAADRAGVLPARPASTTDLQGAAAEPAAELLPALRPPRDRPVHPAVPGHADPRGHGARHRRAPHRSTTTAPPRCRACTPPAMPPPGRRSAAAFTGGGSHNAAWAISRACGPAAARPTTRSSLGHAARAPRRPHGAGTAGLRPTGTAGRGRRVPGRRRAPCRAR